MLEASRRLGVARGTVQARLDKLEHPASSSGWGPEVDPAALGYPVTAFVTLEIRQVRGHDPVGEQLAAIPEVLEVHTITGSGDLLCRVVARSNADLQRVIDAIVAVDGGGADLDRDRARDGRPVPDAARRAGRCGHRRLTRPGPSALACRATGA